MKNKNVKNIFWGVLLIVILLVASHYDYKYYIEDIESRENCIALDIDNQ